MSEFITAIFLICAVFKIRRQLKGNNDKFNMWPMVLNMSIFILFSVSALVYVISQRIVQKEYNELDIYDSAGNVIDSKLDQADYGLLS
jgi:hypothetical protein